VLRAANGGEPLLGINEPRFKLWWSQDRYDCDDNLVAIHPVPLADLHAMYTSSMDADVDPCEQTPLVIQQNVERKKLDTCRPERCSSPRSRTFLRICECLHSGDELVSASGLFRLVVGEHNVTMQYGSAKDVSLPNVVLDWPTVLGETDPPLNGSHHLQMLRAIGKSSLSPQLIPCVYLPLICT